MSVTSAIVGLTVVTTICVISTSAAELRVQVTETGTSAPVRASVVAVGAFPRVISGMTDAAGNVVLEVPSLDKLALAIRSDTHGIKCIAPENTRASAVSVMMTPSIRVFGVVTDAAGRPVTDAIVTASYDTQPECRVRFDIGAAPARTNERGEYVVRNVDLERNPVLRFQHPSFKEITVDKFTFSESDRTQRRRELNVRLQSR